MNKDYDNICDLYLEAQGVPPNYMAGRQSTGPAGQPSQYTPANPQITQAQKASLPPQPQQQANPADALAELIEQNPNALAELAQLKEVQGWLQQKAQAMTKQQPAAPQSPPGNAPAAAPPAANPQAQSIPGGELGNPPLTTPS
jgi:hypothetical protein